MPRDLAGTDADAEDRFEAIAAAAALGSLVAAPLPVKPGAVASWCLTTSRGAFHVKRFARGRDAGLRRALETCAQVELAAARAGVSLAEPVALLLELGDEIVQVHRWWPGRPVAPGDAVAAWLGQTMATLHTLPPPAAAPSDALTSYYGLHPESVWQAWFDEGRARGRAWAGSREALRAVLASMAVICEGLDAERVRAGTHRDLLGGNVLTDGHRFALVDWDCAGPDVPWFEAVRAAVEFGRLAATTQQHKPLRPDPQVARSVLAGYAAAGGARGVGSRVAMSGVLGMMLWRVAFAVRASLGLVPETAEARAAQTAYLPGALDKLVERLRTLDAVAAEIGL
jgi:hypothetical protein